MAEFYDALETRSGDEREAALLGALPAAIAAAMKNAPGWKRHLKGVDAKSVTSRAQLAQLPVLRKSDLKTLQRDDPPLGGFAAVPVSGMGRIFMSPGPIFEPQGASPDPWRGARALYAAGFRKADVVHNSFAYHLTPGGFILDMGAQALGCAVVAAGIGNTEMQLEAIAALKPACYTGTPDYLKILLDKADELGRDAGSLTKAVVSGAALPESLRAELKSRGLMAFQAYATADVGMIAFETEALEGMVVDEGAIVEIVRPGTGEPVADGEVGEVVVTNLNADYPMFRLATGDLSAMLSGESPCGRTNMRIKGWMGRADQTTKVKGMFVHPEQIAMVASRHAELGRLRLMVTRENGQDVMTLRAESGSDDKALADKVAETLHAATKLKGRVDLVAPDSLPNDGKIIADERDYS